MKRLGLVLVIVLLLSIPVYALDYRAMYEEMVLVAEDWQNMCFELSAEIGRQKKLTEDALRLYREAEADNDRLIDEIAMLQELVKEQDALIELQSSQLKKLMGTERYTWLLMGLLAGTIGGHVINQ